LPAYLLLCGRARAIAEVYPRLLGALLPYHLTHGANQKQDPIAARFLTLMIPLNISSTAGIAAPTHPAMRDDQTPDLLQVCLTPLSGS